MKYVRLAILLVIIFNLFKLEIFAQENEKVQLYLKWTHQYQFAGYYVAKDKGFFKEEGIDVEIVEREKSWYPLEKVIEGPGHYAVSDSSIVLHYLEKKPVLIVSAIFQHSPLVFATLKRNRYLGPLELKGKKIMYQVGQDDANVEAMFKNVGLKESDFIPVKHKLNMEPLFSGEVDAISVYSTNLDYKMKKKGVEYHIIDPASYGVDFYGDLFVTSKSEADNNPERVKAMRRAVLKGWRYALDNIEESLNITSKYSSIPIDDLRFEAQETKKIILPDKIDIGSVSLDRLRRIARVYEKNTTNGHLEKLIFDNYLYSKSLPALFSKWWRFIASAILIFVAILGGHSFWVSRSLRLKTKELEESNAIRERFFSSITHELRTPLNGIIGISENLKTQDISKEEINEGIDIINHSSGVLLELVNDILDLSKIESQKFTLSENDFLLSDLINNLEKVYSHYSKNEDLKFVVKTEFCHPYEKEPFIFADNLRLLQVLNNLLSNAFKYTLEGEVTLDVRLEQFTRGAYIHFCVTDTGMGVAKENLDKLFAPFHQLEQPEDIKFKGTGLGLSITKELVNLMDGEIDVSSVLGKGTSFNINIPVTTTEYNELVATEDIEVLTEDISNIKVLLIDDNNINLKVLDSFLKRIGVLNIESTTDPREALNLLDANDYDIIFTDMLMPHVNGANILSFIRSHKRMSLSDAFVVACTANPEYINEDDFEFDFILSKPVRRRNLLSILANYRPSHLRNSA